MNVHQILADGGDAAEREWTMSPPELERHAAAIHEVASDKFALNEVGTGRSLKDCFNMLAIGAPEGYAIDINTVVKAKISYLWSEPPSDLHRYAAHTWPSEIRLEGARLRIDVMDPYREGRGYRKLEQRLQLATASFLRRSPYWTMPRAWWILRQAAEKIPPVYGGSAVPGSSSVSVSFYFEHRKYLANRSATDMAQDRREARAYWEDPTTDDIAEIRFRSPPVWKKTRIVVGGVQSGGRAEIALGK